MSDNDINDLLKAFENPNHCYPQDLVDAIRLLVKERDVARQECCLTWEAVMGRAATTIAEEREWDCFKEDGK